MQRMLYCVVETIEEDGYRQVGIHGCEVLNAKALVINTPLKRLPKLFCHEL